MFIPDRIRGLSVLVLVLSCILTAAEGLIAQQNVVDPIGDPPARKYQLKGKVSEILRDEAQLRRLSGELIESLNERVKTYPDHAKILFQISYLSLLTLHAERGEYDQASATIAKLRALDESAAAKQAALFEEAWINAKREAADESAPEFRNAFERHFAAAFARFPGKDVADLVESLKGRLALANGELFFGTAEAQLQPILDRSGGHVEEDVAVTLFGLKFYGEHFLPLKDEMLRVLTSMQSLKADAAAAGMDIWARRNFTLTATDAIRPVVVAVWDAGVDVRAIPIGNRFVNPSEILLDGNDNDGNGFVDDLYGIGYDLPEMKVSGRVLDDPAKKINSDVRRLQELTKGMLDVQSGIKSSEAADLQATMAALKREQAKDFSEELAFYAQHSHGTHVAGIIVDGNPAAKILTARVTNDHHLLQKPYTLETAEFKARMYRDIVAYFKKQGVRVVNMSWRYNSVPILQSLLINGIGESNSERLELADKYFEIEKRALFEAIKTAPEILFICASGNEGQDVNRHDYIPASFDLPNLITVGAVDHAGKKTSFTNTGRGVDFYANGFEIESLVPGGGRIKFSGTSMASPQVANLAAKLLAVRPALTPGALIRLIGRGSEPSAEDPKIRLINPRRSTALARRKPGFEPESKSFSGSQ